MIDLTVDALATARLTRLITTDRITRRARAAVIRTAFVWRDGFLSSDWRAASPSDWEQRTWLDPDNTPPLAYLVQCPWCVGVYVAAAVAVARRTMPTVWDPLARGLAAAAVAGLVATAER